MFANLTDITGSVLCPCESASGRLANVVFENGKVIESIPELDSERMKRKVEVLSLEERVSELRVYRNFVSSAIVGVDAHRD